MSFKEELELIKGGLNEPVFTKFWNVWRTAVAMLTLAFGFALFYPLPTKAADEFVYMVEGQGSRVLLSEKPCTDPKIVAVINKYNPDALKQFKEGRAYLAQDKKEWPVCWRYMGVVNPENGEVMIPLARAWVYEDEATGDAELEKFETVPATTPVNPNNTDI